jgi:hypothetical protein
MLMGDLLKLIWYAVAGLFWSRAALQTEVLALRHQLNVLRRRAPLIWRCSASRQHLVEIGVCGFAAAALQPAELRLVADFKMCGCATPRGVRSSSLGAFLDAGRMSARRLSSLPAFQNLHKRDISQ